jgi:hypothetical protein
VIKGVVTQNLGCFQRNEGEINSIRSRGLTARQDCSDCHSLYACSPTAPGCDLNAPWTQVDPLLPLKLAYSFLLPYPFTSNLNEKHTSPLSLTRRRGPPLGKALPFDPGSTESIPVSPWWPLPFPLGISSIPLLLFHGFHYLGFIRSKMRIQFWTMDSLDW